MRIEILLSTHDGERFLAEQLDSLLEQTLGGVEILARDDGSTDGTRAMLDGYRRSGRLRWYGGERLGAARSFWRLLGDSGEADYYAFCDQDDVWDADKLEIAVRALERIGTDAPALYCGDVRVADAGMRIISEGMVKPTPTDYPHALFKKIAPGCTYVFNHSARDLLRGYDAEALGIGLHDWTALQIVACFGRVIFDETPHMRYRQHGDNAIGAHRRTALSLLRKLPAFWSGPMKNSRERQALRLERAFGEKMTAENRALTAMLAHYRSDKAQKRALLKALKAMPGKAERRLGSLLIRMNKL